MPRRLSVTVEHFPLAREFRIARGAKTEAVVVTLQIGDEYRRGPRRMRALCALWRERRQRSSHEIEEVRAAIEAGASRERIGELLPAGAARNALDCALWDLEAKSTSRSVGVHHLRRNAPRPVETAYTIGLGDAGDMGTAARVANRGAVEGEGRHRRTMSAHPGGPRRLARRAADPRRQ